MSKTIHREQLEITEASQVLPVGAGRIVHVAQDREGKGKIDVWFEKANARSIAPDRKFRVIPTGEFFPEGYEHVGTVIVTNGTVWHVIRERSY